VVKVVSAAAQQRGATIAPAALMVAAIGAVPWCPTAGAAVRSSRGQEQASAWF
jgi:hypothetical protein